MNFQNAIRFVFYHSRSITKITADEELENVLEDLKADEGDAKKKADEERAAKEQTEKRKLADEAMAVAAAAKKAQQERAEAERKRLSEETEAPPVSLTQQVDIGVPPSAETRPVTETPTEEEETDAEASAVDDTEPPVGESETTAKPGLVASWVTAGAAGLKVAAGVGANLAAATATATRASIVKVSEATKNISFASADSVRYTKVSRCRTLPALLYYYAAPTRAELSGLPDVSAQTLHHMFVVVL